MKELFEIYDGSAEAKKAKGKPKNLSGFHPLFEDIDDYEKEYDRMDRELDMARDHQRQVLCNIMEEVDALDILLHDDRLNRRRMQGAVKIIRQMINREL